MDLERVDRITAGAVGEPGERTFFLQAREGDRSITILVEKEQVELLGTSILEILATVGRETGEGPPSDELGLEPPLEPLWRAGRLSIGYAEERDLMLLEIEELVEPEDEQDEPEDEPEDEPDDEPEGAAAPRPWTRAPSPGGSGSGRPASRCWRSRGTARPSRSAVDRSAGTAGTRSIRRGTCAPR